MDPSRDRGAVMAKATVTVLLTQANAAGHPGDWRGAMEQAKRRLSPDASLGGCRGSLIGHRKALSYSQADVCPS